MGSVNKFLVLTFIFLALSSLMLFSVNFVNVCAVYEPSVPQFSVKFIDESYDVPPTQTTDPYTGKTTTQSGYHVNEGLIEVTIKNQPFPSETDSNNQLYYRVEYKGSFGSDNDWHTLTPTDDALRPETGYIAQSDSEYTVLVHSPVRFDSGVKLDIRVKAVMGNLQMIHPSWEVVAVSSSDWSKIQTLTIAYGSSSVPPSQTTNIPSASTSDDPYNPTQQNPLWFYLAIVLATACIIIIPIAIVTYLNKQRKNQKHTHLAAIT